MLAHPPSRYCGSAPVPGPPLDVPRGGPWWRGLRLSIQWEALYGIICANAINIPYSPVLAEHCAWAMDKTSRERLCASGREGRTEICLGMGTWHNRTWSRVVVNDHGVSVAGHGRPQRYAEGGSEEPVGDGGQAENGRQTAHPGQHPPQGIQRAMMHARHRWGERSQHRKIRDAQEIVCL
jgi:hypothetical protein